MCVFVCTLPKFYRKAWHFEVPFASSFHEENSYFHITQEAKWFCWFGFSTWKLHFVRFRLSLGGRNCAKLAKTCIFILTTGAKTHRGIKVYAYTNTHKNTHTLSLRESKTHLIHCLPSLGFVRQPFPPMRLTDRRHLPYSPFSTEHKQMQKNTNGRKQPRTHSPLPANAANHSPRNTKCSLNVWCAGGSAHIHCLRFKFQ